MFSDIKVFLKTHHFQIVFKDNFGAFNYTVIYSRYADRKHLAICNGVVSRVKTYHTGNVPKQLIRTGVPYCSIHWCYDSCSLSRFRFGLTFILGGRLGSDNVLFVIIITSS